MVEESKETSEPLEKRFPAHYENEDHECPICLEIMVEPCRLQCKHYFCIQCVERASCQRLECPLCLDVADSSFKMVVDKEFQEYLESKFPQKYQEHKLYLEKIDMLYNSSMS